MVRLSIVIILLVQFAAKAQNIEKTWHLMKPGGDVFGVAAEELKCQPVDTVIVAVMDGGTDPAHPDLADNIWINTKEIPANGIDDDGNGYVDDMHGWNFLGGKNGNVDNETLELTRLYRMK